MVVVMNGMRSGTLPTHQIVGIGEAFEIAGKTMHAEQERLRQLRDKLWNGLQDLEQVLKWSPYSKRCKLFKCQLQLC
jgi:cysteine sulfinate desulfinase/cysteine desulfurase-like protein